MNERMRIHKKPIAEINVVPYVDVMLVLLIIFMVTAPLLTQGVEVELPRGSATTFSPDKKPPLIVTVDDQGQFFLDQERQSIGPNDLAVKVHATLIRDPNRSVLVRGDKNARYGQVMSAMVLLKKSGVSKVGLMTQQDDEG